MATTKDGIRVLHVDDEPDLTQLVADFLEREDDRISVDTATSTSEGLERVTAERFDCIVSDYDMPGQNGIEFLEALREEYPDLPFILYTGKGSEEVASDAISAGATDYLQKGTGTDQYELLANRMRNAVEQSRAQQRVAELGRIRALVNEANQALVRADSRSDVETRVCENISDSDPYLFAWIGEVDAETARVEPRAWAGVEEGYLDTITVTADETETGRGPTGTAIRERQIVVSQNLQEDPEYEPWREDARERGYQSKAAVPLEYNETLYGVLNVYADRPDAFDDDEQEVLTELAGDIGAAIHRVEVEETATFENNLINSLLDNAEDLVYFKDREGRYLRVSEAYADALDLDREEVEGKTALELYPEDQAKQMHEDDLKVMEKGVEVVEREQEVAFSAGVNRWVSTTKVPRYDDDGNIIGMVGISRDITDRKQTEQKLERFKNAVEHAGHAIYITDTDGTIEYVNPAFETITGYSAEEALGRNPRILKSGEMSEGYYEELWETLLDGTVWEEEVINRRQDGELYTAHQTIAPVLDETNDIVAFVAIQSDITERKEREQELQRQNSRLNEFASVVSHDLRNPLNVAQGRATMLQERCDDESQEHLDTIVTSLERMERIIEDTLTLARQGDTVGEMAPIQITSLVKQCWDSVETAGATVDIADEFTIRGGRDRLRHVFENLFRNAVEHGGDDVTVRIGRAGEDRFYVEDDGPGIPAGDRETVLEAGQTSATGGTGLGLTIVKRIAEGHGWEVSVTDGRDGGARFEFDSVEMSSE